MSPFKHNCSFTHIMFSKQSILPLSVLQSKINKHFSYLIIYTYDFLNFLISYTILLFWLKFKFEQISFISLEIFIESSS